MDAWSSFCEPEEGSEVVETRGSASVASKSLLTLRITSPAAQWDLPQ